MKKVNENNKSTTMATAANVQNADTPGDTILESIHRIRRFCAAFARQRCPISPNALAMRDTVVVSGAVRSAALMRRNLEQCERLTRHRGGKLYNVHVFQTY